MQTIANMIKSLFNYFFPFTQLDVLWCPDHVFVLSICASLESSTTKTRRALVPRTCLTLFYLHLTSVIHLASLDSFTTKTRCALVPRTRLHLIYLHLTSVIHHQDLHPYHLILLLIALLILVSFLNVSGIIRNLTVTIFSRIMILL